MNTNLVLVIFKFQSKNPRRMWEDSTKMDLQEVGLEDMDWILWALDRDSWRHRVP